jgi:hypothetical protein
MGMTATMMTTTTTTTTTTRRGARARRARGERGKRRGRRAKGKRPKAPAAPGSARVRGWVGRGVGWIVFCLFCFVFVWFVDVGVGGGVKEGRPTLGFGFHGPTPTKHPIQQTNQNHTPYIPKHTLTPIHTPLHTRTPLLPPTAADDDAHIPQAVHYEPVSGAMDAFVSHNAAANNEAGAASSSSGPGGLARVFFFSSCCCVLLCCVGAKRVWKEWIDRRRRKFYGRVVVPLLYSHIHKCTHTYSRGQAHEEGAGGEAVRGRQGLLRCVLNERR